MAMRTEQEIRDRLDRVWLDIGGYMLNLDRCEAGVQVAMNGQGMAAAGVIAGILEWVLGDDRLSTTQPAAETANDKADAPAGAR